MVFVRDLLRLLQLLVNLRRVSAAGAATSACEKARPGVGAASPMTELSSPHALLSTFEPCPVESGTCLAPGSSFSSGYEPQRREHPAAVKKR